MSSHRFRRGVASIVLALSTATAWSAEPVATVRLWPARAPGETKEYGPEAIVNPTPDRPVERLTNVDVPTIAVYKPAADKDTGAAVIVCPGGGYNILAIDLEGREVCDWLNSIGVTGVLLKYRVPRRDNERPHVGPVQDGQRAVSITRSRAKEWGIDPQRIGILGFSAGGNLSSIVLTNFDRRSYEPIDAADESSCRPDFGVLVYPAYLAVDGKLSPLVPVTRQTPPIFLVHAGNDRIGPENSILLYSALHAAGVGGELHVFASGGHGFGLRPSDHPASQWPDRCAAWLKNEGWLAPR